MSSFFPRSGSMFVWLKRTVAETCVKPNNRKNYEIIGAVFLKQSIFPDRAIKSLMTKNKDIMYYILVHNKNKHI